MNMRAKVCEVPEGFASGDYAIQFEFELPKSLPSTMEFEDADVFEHP